MPKKEDLLRKSIFEPNSYYTLTRLHHRTGSSPARELEPSHALIAGIDPS